MRAPYSLSCLFLLSLGTCFPPSQPQEPGHPGEWTLLGPSWRAAAEDAGAGWRAGAKRRRSEELGALLSIARELRSYGEEGAGQRAGRQRGSELRAGEKRSGTLGNLAEELNGYNRRKGGFTFRFGR
ncbi:orexigenic neuropeptide QRFP [Strigops habroptila]|uniref:Pyroglutamylated RFamide peptide n=1 Tax=Strigops habroptila TaxID=2489341 RepID=A0A672V0N6_STRHB|nr:orexigenic neuropeptide QRFP [Strigops habroptila]